MDPAESRFVHKYFEPADRFLRVRVLDPVRPGLRAGEGLDGEGYRRLVVAACVEGMEEPEEGLQALGIAEHESALERLFELALSVNPTLDIHAVSLGEPAAPLPTPEVRRAPGEVRRRLRRRARGLGERLARRIVGQDPAVSRVAAAIRRGAAGLAAGRGPLARLLFVGPTGTGKTEMARALAEELGLAPLVRIDCGEFAEGHEYSKLIGAPPGYVGHEDGGFLTEALCGRPDSVVLFDEVEKAHPRLHHLLLGLLEEGELTDGKGQTTDLRRAIVLFTSNTGARELARAAGAMGFRGEGPLGRETIEEISRNALDRAFRPEFLARLDEVLPFDELGEGALARIAELELGQLAVRVRRRRRRVRFSTAVARWAAREGAREGEGARGILRVIRRTIEAPLADLLLEPAARDAGWIRVSIRAGRPRFAIES